MIRSLRLKNLALVDDLLWEIGPGFNTLTGETGAGKSILIDGLNLLLGERADKTLIRTGEQACAVEADIAVGNKRLLQQINAVLEEIGAEPCEDSTLLLKRSFTSTGANKQFANGSAVTLAGLKRLGDLLVDVHGPHDHQSLLLPQRQTAILDAYAKLDPQLETTQSTWDALRAIRQKRESLQLDEATRAQKVDLLSFQVKEIEGAQLKPGDDETVEREYKIASNARQLIELGGTITDILSESEGSVLAQLASVERSLSAWQKIDASLEDTAALNRSAIAQLQELYSSVTQRIEGIDADNATLSQLEERLNLIQKLKKKYGPTLADVIVHGQRAAEELETLQSSDEALARLAAEEAAANKAFSTACDKLSAARHKAAGPLGEKIQKELRGLGFNKALFRIDVASLNEPGRDGIDRVEFIFAPNVGEEPRPLRAIASSGEMARVMLAIKTTLAEVDDVPVLVFDEIDANVGGETATQVGKKLRGLGKSHQVLCITHLPQVAAQGQQHFSVAKSVRQNRSVTELTRLGEKDRAREIARMLGGQNSQSLALAESLLEQ
jgi:DNA repair protein RecN (Recombination protein N)